MSLIKVYFNLQKKLISRQIREFGLHPVVAIFLGMLVFSIFSWIVYTKTNYANYVILGFYVYYLTVLSDLRRDEFLQSILNRKQFVGVRMFENFIFYIPFLVVLLCYNNFSTACIGMAISILMGLNPIKRTASLTIPTPFYKKPFEHIVGFRNFILIIFLAYILCVISIQVNNFNLGIFSMVLISLISMSFYNLPEESYFVWMYNISPYQFLIKKLQEGIFHHFILIIPSFLILLYFNPSQILIILIVYLISILYLSFMIIAKYANYPKQISIPQSILIIMSFLIPPILLYTFPLFFKRSIRQLTPFSI